MNKILSIVPAEGVTVCDRCFKQISWVARVQTNEGILSVGVDCAETLTGKKYKTPKREGNKVSAFRSWFKKYFVRAVPCQYGLRFQSQRNLDQKASVFDDPRFPPADWVLDEDWVRIYCPEIYEQVKTV